MPRKRFDVNSTCSLHITNRCHNGEAFRIPLPEAWDILCNMLRFTSYSFGLQVHSFVLMPNHYHLMAHAPEANISKSMCYFNRESSRLINRDSGTINQVWGDRYHKCAIDSYHYYMNAYKYLYQNPLRAGLVERVEDYKYSTLHQALGYDRMCVALDDELLYGAGNHLGQHLEWLNRLPKEEDLVSIRKALRRSKFKLPKMDSRPNRLEHQLF